MDLDLRQAVITNIKGKSTEQLKDMVEIAIVEKEEKTLPGLGVVFEVIWQHTDGQTKDTLIKTLSQYL